MVARLTEVSPVVLLNIVIIYLMEEGKFEPWFIGTEKCEVLTQKITAKKLKLNKKNSQPYKLPQQKQNQEISAPGDVSEYRKQLDSYDLVGSKSLLEQANCKS